MTFARVRRAGPPASPPASFGRSPFGSLHLTPPARGPNFCHTVGAVFLAAVGSAEALADMNLPPGRRRAHSCNVPRGVAGRGGATALLRPADSDTRARGALAGNGETRFSDAAAARARGDAGLNSTPSSPPAPHPCAPAQRKPFRKIRRQLASGPSRATPRHAPHGQLETLRDSARGSSSLLSAEKLGELQL